MNPQKTSALWNSFLLLLIFIGYNVVTAFFQLALQIGRALGRGEYVDYHNLPFNGTLMSIAMIMAGALAIGLLWISRLTQRPWIKPAPQGVMRAWGWGIVAFFLVAMGVNQICEPLQLDDLGMEPIFRDLASSVWGVVAIVFLGPLIEELVFRAGILRQLIKAGFNPIIAVIGTGLLFGCAHMNWAQAIPATVLGIMLGLLYLKVGDIRLSLLAHILNNALGVITLLTVKPGENLYDLPLWSEILIGIAVTAAGVALTHYWWRQSKPEINSAD